MTLEHRLGPGQFELDSEVYDLLDLGGGRVRWDVEAVQGQPGDATQVKTAPLEWQAGYGATHRITRGSGRPSDPGHHHYAQNAMAITEGHVHPSPRVTYIDMTSYAPSDTGFEVGGDGDAEVGMIGGEVSSGIGGGAYNEEPQFIREFGGVLYINAGAHTFVVDPDSAAPAVVDVRAHGSSARARKSDVFGNQLVVALGAGENMDVATTPYTDASVTQWSASQVARDVVATGVGGRLFSSLGGLVYNVLAGADPLLSASYLPSNGERITDESDPVRSLTEFSSALVAGTARSARTFDPDRGYQGVPITGESRLSTSEFDGRAMLSIGPLLFYATKAGVKIIRPNAPPIAAGPELLHHNESPYVGAEWGHPDYLGDWMAWPAYFPETGDSVIFIARLRDQDGETGTGPVVWHDAIWLDDRICRTVRLWGGSATRGPRLFFGAGTTASPYQAGWVDWFAGGGYELAQTDAIPALSSFIEGPLDDLGLPGVNKAVEKVEWPDVENADATNYVVFQAQTESGSLMNLVKAQTGSNQERVNSEGFVTVYPQTASPITGRQIRLRATFTQASGAASFVTLHGTGMLYYTEVPTVVDLISAVVDAKTQDHEEAQVIADRLLALKASAHVRQQYAPDGKDRYVKVIAAKVTTVERNGTETDMRLGIELTMREVITG